MTLDGFAQQSLDVAMVLIVSKNSLSLIAPADHVVQSAREMHARSSAHEPDLPPNCANKQITKA